MKIITFTSSIMLISFSFLFPALNQKLWFFCGSSAFYILIAFLCRHRYAVMESFKEGEKLVSGKLVKWFRTKGSANYFAQKLMAEKMEKDYTAYVAKNHG